MRHVARIEELRSRADQVARLGQGARMALDARDYAHWADVRFLLAEVDRLAAAGVTPATLPALPAALPPVLGRPGDFDVGWNAAVTEAEARVAQALARAIFARASMVDLRLQVLIAVRSMRLPPTPQNHP